MFGLVTNKLFLKTFFDDQRVRAYIKPFFHSLIVLLNSFIFNLLNKNIISKRRIMAEI